MKTYKFRAECESDVDFVLEILEDLAFKIVKTADVDLPDMVVEFDSFTDLVSIKNMLILSKNDEDIHVILDTIELKENYTGERTYEN